MVFFQLFLMLILILVASEVFTNALEHFGEKLGISEGVTGSLFAAIGTALPETIVPLLALLAGSHSVTTNEEIGVGSILGAPFMLATLSISLMAISVWKRRGSHGLLRPERTGLKRDLNFFIIAFSFAAIAMYVPHTLAVVRYCISATMILTYIIYVVMTLNASKALVADGHATEAESEMFLCRIGFPNNNLVIVLQLLIGITLLIVGAKGFINDVEVAAQAVGISTLLLSLLIIPIATELPEKVNSILWIRKGKDTLAFANITGAMVFQGTLLPAIGITLTPWQPTPAVALGIALTLIAAIWLRYLAEKLSLRVWHLLINGSIYIIYWILVLN